MKKIMILFAVLLIGASVISGVVVSAYSDWNVKGEIPDEPMIWMNLDENNVCDFGEITIEPFKPITSVISLYVDTGFYLVGKDVTITLENNGDRPAYFYGPSYHWTIEQYNKDHGWERIYPYGVELAVFLITHLDPGGKEVNVWHQNTCDMYGANVQVEPGDYRVVVTYSVGERKYRFTEYLYFTIGEIASSVGNRLDNVAIEIPDLWKSIRIDDPKCIPVQPLEYVRIPSPIYVPIEPPESMPWSPPFIRLPPIIICDPMQDASSE
ncbi:MAG: hypothetical protein KAR64_03255 [Thermoplasmatales archaeon]|nr:hypothetical protein [Thermoplasmatales archaeon]